MENSVVMTSRSTKQEPRTILGLVGSPRRLGNCEILIKEVSLHTGVEHRLKLIRLPSLTILPCKACYRCVSDEECPQRDDLTWLLDEIVAADALLIASPVYFLGAHSIFKQILDRGFLFFQRLRETYGKPCALMTLYGMTDRIGTAPQTLQSLASFLGLMVTGKVTLKGDLPGEVLRNRCNQEAAIRLGQGLFSAKPRSVRSGCPYCGCEILRLERARLVCTNCHGRFAVDEKGKRLKLKEGDIFGSPDFRLLHKEWLRKMKQRFMKDKKGVLRRMAPYKTLGDWLN